VLQVTFVRDRGQRDHVYVARRDGTATDWAFPSYGDGLPHDLCHLVVEDELGLAEGFWGLVDQGVEVRLVRNEATLCRGGRPLADQPGVDLAGLMQAEAAVALLAPPGLVVETVGDLVVARPVGDGARPDRPDRHGDAADVITDLTGQNLPTTATPEAVTAIQRRLGEYAQQWRQLEDRGAITVMFSGPGVPT
jgi:hypothetical protein